MYYLAKAWILKKFIFSSYSECCCRCYFCCYRARKCATVHIFKDTYCKMCCVSERSNTYFAVSWQATQTRHMCACGVHTTRDIRLKSFKRNLCDPSLPLSVTLISRVPFYFHAHKFSCLLPTLFERKMLSHFGRKWAGKKTNKMKMKEREKRCGLDFRNHYGFRLHSFVLVQTNGPQQIYTTRKQIQNIHRPSATNIRTKKVIS